MDKDKKSTGIQRDTIYFKDFKHNTNIKSGTEEKPDGQIIHSVNRAQK